MDLTQMQQCLLARMQQQALWVFCAWWAWCGKFSMAATIAILIVKGDDYHRLSTRCESSSPCSGQIDSEGTDVVLREDRHKHNAESLQPGHDVVRSVATYEYYCSCFR